MELIGRESEHAELNDPVRAQRHQAELDALVDHLTDALGQGGRARKGADTAERARSAVTQRIRSTIRAIGPLHPALARHLEASIQTGYYCAYRPEHETTWTIG